MIGIILATHGQLGTGLCSSAEVILGEPARVCVLELAETDCLEGFRRVLFERVVSADAGEGVLVLTDLLGGTPANAALLVQRMGMSRAVAGVNLAMLLEVLLNRDTMSLVELTEAAVRAGAEGIRILEIDDVNRGKNQ